MQKIKNIYQQPSSINQDSHYFLRPKHSALPSMLEPFQDIKLNYRLPKLSNSYNQSSSEEQKTKSSHSHLQKLSSNRYLSKFVRSTTIEEPILKKNQEIIQSCDLKIKEHKKQLAKVYMKLQANQILYRNYLHQELQQESTQNYKPQVGFQENSFNFYNYQQPQPKANNILQSQQLMHFRQQSKRFRTNQSVQDK
ncbi:unnamed protein product (macronuclear) [Paramecium tetraurelia]|uniref:Uncharacterized protein n=1 Tax=Paramecium tetraurelia TaxID=5888 RepID=A0DXN8_PARTE|nr:uncharacterized protein GSPATT00021429001 [Paramecium tetraurelia]CAK87805.1 unnamed protein product [Paramecium tetraurelia]|eukprot:XP_001455202.1 hypothetical protein (macronuclear) [Paramecium tetraurelia strain d4-2]